MERTIDIGMRKIREALEETEAQLENGYQNGRRMDEVTWNELRRYRERDSVHIRPLLSSMFAYLMFPGEADTPSTGEMLERLRQARTFGVCGSSAAEDANAAADATGAAPLAPTK